MYWSYLMPLSRTYLLGLIEMFIVYLRMLVFVSIFHTGYKSMFLQIVLLFSLQIWMCPVILFLLSVEGFGRWFESKWDLTFQDKTYTTRLNKEKT